MTLTLFIILALATTRLSQLIVKDKILDTPRSIILMRFPADESIESKWHPIPRDSWRSSLKNDISLYDRFFNPRIRMWMRYSFDDIKIPREGTFIGNLLSCIDCTSIWAAGLIYALHYYQPMSSMPLMLILAFSQVVITINNTTRS